MIVLVDNYDSFSYNLYQLAGEFTSVRVIRNDEMTVQQLSDLHPEGILLSPGPGRPENAGICIQTVQELKGRIPILGVCLGHQSIVCAYGGKVSYAKHLCHGKQSEAALDSQSLLFGGLPDHIRVGRYHSLAAVEESLPKELKVTARTDDGEIMAVEDAENRVYGLQFHPESILTPDGAAILRNWISSLSDP